MIKPYKSLAIIGMCKNAGKTTVLNAALDGITAPVGITSVGRDGESTDIVTRTPKPQIFVKEGSYVATASSLLPHCTTTRQILKTTGFYTPLGEVVIFRALSAGYVEIAGPSTVSSLCAVKEMLFELGAERVILDGAIGRRSLGAAADGAILASGASYSTDMSATIDETAFIAGLYSLKKADFTGGEENVGITDDGEIFGTPSELYADSRVKKVYLAGALSDGAVKSFCTGRPQSKTVIVEDSSKILASSASMRKFYARGGSVEVSRESRLICVTVNPYSAYGYDYDAEEFKSGMQAAVDCPVLNVMEEKRGGKNAYIRTDDKRRS